MFALFALFVSASLTEDDRTMLHAQETRFHRDQIQRFLIEALIQPYSIICKLEDGTSSRTIEC